MNGIRFAFAVAFGLVLVAGPVSADLITFDFTCESGCLEDDGADGNSLSFTQNGLTVTVTAYNNFFALGPYAAGELTQYEDGLGVEATPIETSDSTDNFGNEDVLLFEFSEAGSSAFVDPASVSLVGLDGLFVDGDTDANIVLGLGDPGISLAGYGPLDIVSAPFGPFDFVDPLNSPYNGPTGGDPTVHPITNELFGNYLAIAARPLQFDDAFWVSELSVDWTPPGGPQAPIVPEPTTMVLFSLGAGAVALRKRWN